MIVAVACDGVNVSGHFGHCESFGLFTVQDGKIASSEVVANPGHKPGFLPVFLAEKGANVIIAGGMGATAIELFNQNKVDVITGAQGNAEEIVAKYIAGNLVSTGSVCTEHQHHDECGH